MSSRSLKALAGIAGASAAALGTGAVGTSSADAAVITQSVSIPIPATIDGVYLNVVTLASGGTSFAGYDVNLYATSTAPGPSFFTSSTANSNTANRGYSSVSTSGAALNLTDGSVVGPSSIYNTGVTAGTNFSPGVAGIVGFRFFNEADSALHYGYLNFIPPSTSTTGTAGLITSISYESTANTAITVAVPEPASLGALAMGAVGLLARRGKKTA